MGRSNKTRRLSPHQTPKFGNSNGTLVPESTANDGMQGTGSWEKSAISARFFLKCQLRNLRAFCSHHLPGDFPLAGLFQSGWLPRSVQPPSSSPSPLCPYGVFDC